MKIDCSEPLEQLEQHLSRAAQTDHNLWLDIATNVYDRDYTFYPKTTEEIDWVDAAMGLVRQTCPEPWRKGVHSVNRQANACGEDIYMVDGTMQHVLWVRHKQCNRYTLLHRWLNDLWCATCNHAVPRKQFVQS